MKIVKNTSDIPTAFLRMLFTRCHNRLAYLEGKRLRAWRFLKVTVRQGDKRHNSGYAFYNVGPITLTLSRRGIDSYQVQEGHDKYESGYEHSDCLPGWRMVDDFLPILKTRKIAWVFCHELMHVYGYKHAQQVDPSDADLDVICKGLPELPEQKAPPAKAAAHSARDIVSDRHRRMVMRRVAWQAKKKRAENALTKVEREIRTYEARYGSRLEK